MRSLFLTISRFCVCAWIGAAVLFVVTSIAEARSPEFTSEVKAALALLRFQYYYAFGFVLVFSALLAAFLSGGHWAVGGFRRWVYRGLLTLALGTMIVDYVAVFQPMERMLAASEAARPAEFEWYHRTVMYTNAGQLGLCLLGALLICWPGSKRIQ